VGVGRAAAAAALCYNIIFNIIIVYTAASCSAMIDTNSSIIIVEQIDLGKRTERGEEKNPYLLV